MKCILLAELGYVFDARSLVGLIPDARPCISMLDPNRVIAKYVKSCTYCYCIICATFIVRVGGIPWPRTGTTQTKFAQARGGLSAMIVLSLYISDINHTFHLSLVRLVVCI